MNIVIFKYIDSVYIKTNFVDNHLDPLAHFLGDDAGPSGGSKFFQEWLSSSSTDTGGNESWLRKHSDGTIEVSYLDDPIACFITKENLSQLLDQWDKLYITGIPYIKLYEEDHRILLAPYGENI